MEKLKKVVILEQFEPLSTEDGDAMANGETKRKPRKKRQAWDSKWQYLAMVVSYAVGLGNVWRFPYLVQRDGGGGYILSF